MEATVGVCGCGGVASDPERERSRECRLSAAGGQVEESRLYGGTQAFFVHRSHDSASERFASEIWLRPILGQCV
jgi:hypothetical protein